jgi:hypothetical protein
MRFGTVQAYHKPWYAVLFDGEAEERKMRGRELAGLLLFEPADFRNPMLFHFDFSDMNPLLCPGWVLGMHGYLHEYNVILPRAWLDRGLTAEREGRPVEIDASDYPSFREAERAALRDYCLELTGESRATSTLDGLRHPALKALWWFASRGCALPPTPEDATMYLAYLALHVNTKGSVECARGAIAFMCTVNGWDKSLMLGGRARVPIDAMRRRHVGETHKSAGLTVDQVRAVMRAYISVRFDLTWQQQWRVAFGIGLCTMFKTLARYDDLRQLRYDATHFTRTDIMIELLVVTRKNNQEHSTRVSIARAADRREFGVYDALVLGHELFGGHGFIMPHVDAAGLVHRERPMEYDDFVRFLRHGLVYATGMSEEEAGRYAGHSARSGAGTAAAQSGLQPHQICHLAGVKDINWLVGYMRESIGDRLRASWAVGL